MCREQLEEMEEGEEILEFQLAERFTFLEYIPSEKISGSAPAHQNLQDQMLPDAFRCQSPIWQSWTTIVATRFRTSCIPY